MPANFLAMAAIYEKSGRFIGRNMALHIQVLGEKRDSGPLHERQPLKRIITCCQNKGCKMQ